MEKQSLKKQYSAPEVANLLGISRVAVFKKIKAGEIKAQKIGRNYVINKKDLQKYLNLEELSEENKKQIDTAVKRATNEYREAFKMLGNE
jgi:excisionase family DNA binding protein